MLKISGYLESSSSKANEIFHEVLIDPDGPSLAAVLIGGLLESASTTGEIEKQLLLDLIQHLRGCKGGDISQADLRLVAELEEYSKTGRIKGSKRMELISNIRAIATARSQLTMSGDPMKDWLQIRDLLSTASHEALKAVADHGRYVRLLRRGTQLREGLTEQWKLHHSYKGAREIISTALTQEHFAASTRTWKGVNLMTMHKSKGKEFDEVIIFEGYMNGRLLRDNVSANDEAQARNTLRVAVTRARLRTTILTPAGNVCPML